MRGSAVCLLFAAATGVLAPAALAQAEPQSSPPQDSREPSLQAAVDAMVELVEKHAALEFPEPPRVRATTHQEWRELVQREFGLESSREVFETSLATFGLYLPASREVVLSPLVVAPLIGEPLTRALADDAPRRHREAVAHQKATVVHELVHALQEMHYQLPSKLAAADEEDEDEILRLKCLIEGHAVFVEERVAERELGLASFMARSSYTGLGGLGNDPSYAVGRNYFVHVFRTEGMRGVLDQLADPPPLDVILARAKMPLPPDPEAAIDGAAEVTPQQKPDGDRQR